MYEIDQNWQQRTGIGGSVFLLGIASHAYQDGSSMGQKVSERREWTTRGESSDPGWDGQVVWAKKGKGEDSTDFVNRGVVSRIGRGLTDAQCRQGPTLLV